MRHDSRSAQPPPPLDHSASSSSRWLVVAVAVCGAFAGGSIVEAVAAVASGTSIAFSPDHLVAGPLALAGAICGGLLAAILASADNSSHDQAHQMNADSLAVSDLTPSEPLMWQPAPPMVPITRTPVSANTPPAPSKRRVLRIHRRVHQVMHRYHPGRLAGSQPSMMNNPRHRGIIHHARLQKKEAGAG